MPFTLQIAADLYDVKVNLILDFPAFPTIADIIATAQATFSFEASVLRPAHAPLQQFSVAKMQLFRDEDGKWVDLIVPSQLKENAQLYIIQSDPNHIENQEQITKARRPTKPMISTGASAMMNSVGRSPVSPPRHGASGTPLTPMPSGTSFVASVPRSTVGRQSPPRNSNQSFSSPLPVVPPPTPVSTYRSVAYGSATSPNAAPYASPASHHSVVATTTATTTGSQVTAADKIRYVFEEMDRNGNRLIELDEFRDLLRALNIEFSASTVTDLFKKADVDRDGVLSMAEFSQFFSAYTTLLDSLYFRLRDVVEGRQLQQDLAHERSLLDQLMERRGRCVLGMSEGAMQTEQQANKVRAMEQEKNVRHQREQELKSLMGQCEDDLRVASNQRASALNDYECHKDREAQQQHVAISSQRETGDAERRFVAEQQQLQLCQEKERQIQAMLLEAQRDVERQQKIVGEAQVGYVRAKDREAQSFNAVEQSQKELQRANDRLSLCEREVILKNERQKELNKVLTECQLELARLAQVADDERRELAACEERDRQNRAVVQETDNSISQQERRLRDKDQDILLFSQRRASMEQQEKPLLEQEVRLREQRDSLEEKEIRLRREAVNYFDAGQRAAAVPIATTASSPLNYSSYRSVSPPRR